MTLCTTLAANQVASGEQNECNLEAEATFASFKQAGDAAMLAQRYQQALACYRAADALSPDVRLLYNQARALELLGEHAESFVYLRRFVNSASDRLKSQVPQLGELLAESRARVALLTVRANVDGATVLVDGEAVGRTPLNEPWVLMPEAALVEVQAETYRPFSKSVQPTAGQEVLIEAHLIPLTPPQSSSWGLLERNAGEASALTPAPPRGRTPLAHDERTLPATGESETRLSSAWGFSALAAGGVALGAALVTYLKARPELDAICPGPGADRDCGDEHDSGALAQYNTTRSLHIASLITSGVFLAGGGVLLWQSFRGTDQPEQKVELSAHLGLGSVRLRGSF